MDLGPGYDVTKLHGLRQELARLNEAALKDGLIGHRHFKIAMPSQQPIVERRRNTSSRAGKASAQRLLDLLGPAEDDRSPLVPGTNFTEDGVVRLLAHLRKPRLLRYRYLQRLHSYLIRPVAKGARASAGVSVERLQAVSRQLLEIKARGWYRFRSMRAARRGGTAYPHGRPSANG